MTALTRLPRYWARPRVSAVPMLAARVTKHWDGTPMWESLARLTSVYRFVPARHSDRPFGSHMGCQHLPCVTSHYTS